MAADDTEDALRAVLDELGARRDALRARLRALPLDHPRGPHWEGKDDGLELAERIVSRALAAARSPEPLTPEP